MSKKFIIAFEETTENVSTEGAKGAIIGFILGNIPGAIIGHFWQEYLIEKEKSAKLLQEKIDDLKKDKEKNGVKQKLEVLEFKLKKNKDELKEIKVKAKEEEVNNKKIEEAKKKQKVSKEEIAETPAPTEEVSEADEVIDTPEGGETVVETTSEEDKMTEISIEELTEQIGRQEELADGLDALKTIAVKVDTPTPTDVALFRVAANMAVAGTDEEAQDFIPAIESNKPIDVKAFDAKIKVIKDKIANFTVALAALEAKKKIK